MKNCIIANPTDTRLSAWWLRENDDFATKPVPVSSPRTPDDFFATELMPSAQSTARQTSELSADWFATELMPAVSSPQISQREQEEAWHTSFEQAISERAARVSQQLRRLSTTALDHALVPATDPLPSAPRSPRPWRPARSGWPTKRRAILLTCLGLCLFLLGFDLMGLLLVLR